VSRVIFVIQKNHASNRYEIICNLYLLLTMLEITAKQLVEDLPINEPIWTILTTCGYE